jgi:CheY-like chemotaxis protein
MGVGTTFRVLLPRCEAPAQSFASSSLAPTIPLGSETVLVVEDEEAVRLLSCLVLRDAGYRVLEAQDAREALELVARHPDKIDILVTDVVLPGMGGRHLAQELLQQDPKLRVLYLSGYLDDAVVRHGVLVNEVNFLQKPFSLTELACKVRSVLDTGNELELLGMGRR